MQLLQEPPLQVHVVPPLGMLPTVHAPALLELEDDEPELLDECVELDEVLDEELVDDVECVELEEVLDMDALDMELVDEVECVELSEELEVLE